MQGTTKTLLDSRLWTLTRGMTVCDIKVKQVETILDPYMINMIVSQD